MTGPPSGKDNKEMFESRALKPFRAYCSERPQGIKMIKAKIKFAQTDE